MEMCALYTRCYYGVSGAGVNEQCEWRKKDEEIREPSKIGKER